MKNSDAFTGRIRLILILVVTLLSVACMTTPRPHPEAQSGFGAERVILNLTETPSTSQAVTWRTRSAVRNPHIELTLAETLNMPEPEIRQIEAKTEAVPLTDKRIVYQHAALIKNLEPGHLYAYRVGNDASMSEWNHFRTAKETAEPFRFVYFGDYQNQIHSMCSRVSRAAYKKAPDAAFWLYTGDIVNSGDRDSEWAEFFKANGWISRTTPFVMAPGNHEYPDKRFIPKDEFAIFDTWYSNFILPENGPAGLEETAYYIDYQGVRFLILNGNEKLEEQVEWLETVLSNNPQKWTIAAMHQPVYSTGKRRKKKEYRKIFVPVFDKYNVDLVLQAHDHNYSRSFPLKNGKRSPENKQGTVYIISVSGPKTYPVNDQYKDLMAVTGSAKQLFQVISVDGNTLSYKSYDATGKLFDEMEIVKKKQFRLSIKLQ